MTHTISRLLDLHPWLKLPVPYSFYASRLHQRPCRLSACWKHSHHSRQYGVPDLGLHQMDESEVWQIMNRLMRAESRYHLLGLQGSRTRQTQARSLERFSLSPQANIQAILDVINTNSIDGSLWTLDVIRENNAQCVKWDSFYQSSKPLKSIKYLLHINWFTPIFVYRETKFRHWWLYY